jgi:hypothetical protein
LSRRTTVSNAQAAKVASNTPPNVKGAVIMAINAKASG